MLNILLTRELYVTRISVPLCANSYQEAVISIGQIWRTMAIACLVAVSISAAFLAINAAAVGYRVETLEAQVKKGFDSGALQDSGWLPGDTVIGAHQFNDCLILLQAVDQRADNTALRVSPVAQSVPAGMEPCPYLHHFDAGERIAQPNFYHRYLHGHTLLVRLLLPDRSVNGLRGLYKGVLTQLLVLGLAISMIGIAGGQDRSVGAAWAVMFMIFSRYFGFESFGESLGHGPSDIIIIGFMLLLCTAWARGGFSRKTAVPASAAFGAFTMIFEFLTGGIPLGAAIILGAMPLALSHNELSDGARTTGHALLAYTVGIVVAIVMKMTLVLYMFGGTPMLQAIDQLALRMTHGAAGETADGTLSAFIGAIVQNLDSLAAGSASLVLSTLAVAMIAGLWAIREISINQSGPYIIKGRLLAASVLIPPLWLMIFWQHSIVHARFMDRILVWMIAAPLMLFTLAVGEKARYDTDAST